MEHNPAILMAGGQSLAPLVIKHWFKLLSHMERNRDTATASRESSMPVSLQVSADKVMELFT